MKDKVGHNILMGMCSYSIAGLYVSLGFELMRRLVKVFRTDRIKSVYDVFNKV